jgi:hypothetical protein
MDQQPDRLEKGIRFGCGAVFGAFLGFLWFGLYWAGISNSLVILAFIGLALVCGVLAMQFGDRFWSGLKDWI